MAIINKEYFKGEIYIAHAIESVSNNVTGVALDILTFIDKYERDCLIKSLGTVLYLEFFNELDDTALDGLLPGANQKWDDLMNGKTYVNPNGDTVNWRGIRYESVNASGNYDMSFLADYTYFYYQQSQQVSVGANGFQHNKSKNSEPANPTPKVVAAWQSFLSIVQGVSASSPEVIYGQYGIGIDWKSEGDTDITLKQFIEDSNELIADTYADYNPTCFNEMNEFGL